MKITKNFIKQTKRHLSASGSILLPLALKWRLVGVAAMAMLSAFGAQSASAASLEITIPSNLSVDVTPSASEAVAESQPAELKVSSDAPWGYTLSVKSSTGSNKLMNGQNELPSISDQMNTTKEFTNNTWGYKFTGGSASNNKYWPGPTTTLTTLDMVTSEEPASTKTEKQYGFTIAANVNNSLAAGMYIGSFTFTAVANSVNYIIDFDANGGTSGPETMTGQTQEKSVKLSNLEPKKSGDHEYTFLGWCDQEVSQDGTCDGNIYQANDNYNLKSANENTTLYAIWDWITMQNWDDCPKNLVKNKQFTLVDSRDSRAYYVAKLADGNCWMTENLDLFIESDMTYVADTTDLEYGDNGKNTTWKPTKPTHETNDMSWDSSNTGKIYPQSYDPGDKCWRAEKVWQEGSHVDTDVKTCSKHDSSHYYVGNYYNYTAAVAQNDTSDHTTRGQAYYTSICPAGWQLPNYQDEKSFKKLQEAISLDVTSPNWVVGYIGEATDDQVAAAVEDTMHAAPYYFTYVGFYGGVHATFGQNNHFHSNAIVNGDTSFSLHYYGHESGYLRTQDEGGLRYHGFSVRCVARQ